MADKELPMKKLKEFIDLFEKSDLASLDVEIKSMKVSFKAFDDQIISRPIEINSVEKEIVMESEDTDKIDDQEIIQKIVSPISGTFYASSSPDAQSFVKVGVKIKKGDVLCIIESMKVMNEIKSLYTGKISKILVKNGDSVDKDSILFYIE